MVYGTELPRLLVNEAYGELVNDRLDPKDGIMMGTKVAAKEFQKKFFVELHNPLPPDTARPELESGTARLQWNAVSPSKTGVGLYTGTVYAAYRLDILEAAATKANALSVGLTDANVTGDPRASRCGDPRSHAQIELNQFVDDRTAAPTASGMITPAAPPAGFTGDDFNKVLPSPRRRRQARPVKTRAITSSAPRTTSPAAWRRLSAPPIRRFPRRLRSRR